MLSEILDIRKRDSEIEIVRAGLQDVEPAARTLGGDQGLEIGIEERWTELFKLLL